MDTGSARPSAHSRGEAARAPAPGPRGRRPHRLVPLWLRWFVGVPVAILLVSVGEQFLGVVQAHLLLAWVVFLLFVLFPGGDPARPRLFFVLSALWALGVLIDLATLVQGMFSVQVFPPPVGDAFQATSLPLVALDGAFYLALLVTLWRRSSAFRPLIVVSTLWGVADEILSHGGLGRNGCGGTTSALALIVCLHIAVAFYLLLHFRVRRATPRGGDAVPGASLGPDAASRC